MKLRDVVDLEAQLAVDEDADEGALRARDRALYLALERAPTATGELLAAWLAALRARFQAPRIGERVAMAQRLVAYGLTLLGVSLGWGVAEVLLHFEQGGAPVNVGHYLFVMVFGQLATLALLALSLLLAPFAHALPLVGDVRRLVRYATSRVERALSDSEPSTRGRIEQQRALYHRVRTRLGLYEPLERALLLSQTQLFAVAFNLGALVSCLRLILLSDLAFAWSTSLAALDAEQIERLCSALAAPFAWLAPDAQPSRELIEHTQYYRLEGRFAGAEAGTRGDPLLAGGWWRFLVACTITYGLVPRAVALLVFYTRYRRAEQRVPLDTPDVQRVLARLTSPALSTRSEAVSPDQAEPARAVTAEAQPHGGPTSLVIFRDVPTDRALLAREVGARLGLYVTRTRELGGAEARGEAAVLEELGASDDSVSVVAEAWEAPDKSLRALLARIRAAVGKRRTVRLVLIGEARRDGFSAAEPEQVRLYRDRLTLLEDAYLSVETLPATEAPALEKEVHP